MACSSRPSRPSSWSSFLPWVAWSSPSSRTPATPSTAVPRNPSPAPLRVTPSGLVQLADDVQPAGAPFRPVWFEAFVVGVIAFAVFAATARYQGGLNNDPHAAAVAAWQLAHHGNATLTAFHDKLPWLYPVDGRDVTDRLPGTIFWATPLYAWMGSSNYPTVYPSAVAAALASAIAV